MQRTSARLLIALLISALPTLGLAAEGASTPKTTPDAQNQAPTAAAPTAPATVPAASVSATSCKLRVGYIDIARIGSESSLGKASSSQAKAKQKKLQAQVMAKKKQLDSQKKALENQFPSLTPAQREAKAKEFQKKVVSFQEFGMKSEKELQALQAALSKSFNEAVSQAGVEYGKSNNLDLVVLRQETVYLSNSVDSQDVTEGVIKLMNDKWKTK